MGTSSKGGSSDLQRPGLSANILGPMLGRSLIAALVLLASTSARGEVTVKVIVNAANPVTRLEREALSRIFLGKTTGWPDGKGITLFEPASAEAQGAFAKQVHLKTHEAIKRYWIEHRYSTMGEPVEKKDDAAVAAAVAKYPGAIGYVTTEPTDPGVKVVEVTP